MAKVFKLTDGTNTLDIASTSVFWLREEGYEPKIAVPSGDGSIPPYMQQSIPVGLQSATDNEMATTLQTLALLQKRAAEYFADPTQYTPVWFHEKLDGETGERRALVRSVEFVPAASWLSANSQLVREGFFGVLVVERYPYWEVVSIRQLPQATPTAAAAVVYDYTAAGAGIGAADIVGDVGAR